MTNVLIITNKNDITSDFIVRCLRNKSVKFYRFNTDELTVSIDVLLDFNQKKFFLFDRISDESINLLNFTSVYFRRPELPDLRNIENNNERNLLLNEIRYTLEGIYKIVKEAYWVSPLYSIREAENKIYQLIIAEQIGFKTPLSVISNSSVEINKFIEKQNKDLVIKPIKTGLIEDVNGTSVIFTSKLDRNTVDDNEVSMCPIYLQTHIRKKADIRVTVVGDKIFATLIDSQGMEQTEVDWRQGEVVLKHSKVTLPSDIEDKCILLLRKLQLRFGAIDFILDKGDKYIFLEINPNGQWAWIEKQVGYEISNEIANLLINENF